jgi:hypothetical protein
MGTGGVFDWEQCEPTGSRPRSELPEAQAGGTLWEGPAEADGNGEKELALEGACSSITLPLTRQIGEHSFQPMSYPLCGVAAVDWWTSSACVKWSSGSIPVFMELDRCKKLAAASFEAVPFTLGDGLIHVHSHGYGKGNETHFEYLLEWCGVRFGLSPRDKSSRQLPNFDLHISGKPCLLFGYSQCRERILDFIEDWGGQVVDEWPRRLDLCLDLPGIDGNQELFPAIKEHRYISGRGHYSLDGVDKDYTGYTFGSKATSIVIYDKLKELQTKKKFDEAYQQGMLLNRWGGFTPGAALRVEYRVNGRFLGRYGILNANQVTAEIPGIVDRLTSTSKRRFFVVTEDAPDRKNRHQDRAKVLPLWDQIVTCFQRAAGIPPQPLQRVDRSSMPIQGHFKQTLGLILSAAAQNGIRLDSVDSIANYIRHWAIKNGVSDEQVLLRFEKKARKLGTWNESMPLQSGNELAA